MTAVLWAAVLLGGGAVAPVAWAEDALERVRRTGELRWGGDVQGGEPFVFEDPSQPDHLIGFESDIAEAIAARIGVRAVFVQNDWSTLVETLLRGTFDLAMNGLEVTEERSRRVRFSRPYHTFAERLSVRQQELDARGQAALRDLGAWRGRRVGVLANSLAWDILGGIGADRVPYEGVQEPYLDLGQGRIDAVLMDDIISDRYGRLPGIVAVADVAEGIYAIGMRPSDDALFTAVDGALGQLIAAGDIGRILAQWKVERPPHSTLSAQPQPRQSAAPRALGGHQVLLFVRGAGVTIVIALAAMAIAVILGLGLALARIPSPAPWRRVASALGTAYVEIFRGTPVLLQLYVLYFALAPLLALDAYAAAILGLGLNYAAYEAEIYRAGISAVPRGQIEAAWALGMPPGLAFRRVVLPQALRVSLPGMTNDFIALLKDTSLVSVITVVELTKRMSITAVDSGGWLVPGLGCAALYFAMSYPLSRWARRIETRLGAGA